MFIETCPHCQLTVTFPITGINLSVDKRDCEHCGKQFRYLQLGSKYRMLSEEEFTRTYERDPILNDYIRKPLISE